MADGNLACSVFLNAVYDLVIETYYRNMLGLPCICYTKGCFALTQQVPLLRRKYISPARTAQHMLKTKNYEDFNLKVATT